MGRKLGDYLAPWYLRQTATHLTTMLHIIATFPSVHEHHPQNSPLGHQCKAFSKNSMHKHHIHPVEATFFLKSESHFYIIKPSISIRKRHQIATKIALNWRITFSWFFGDGVLNIERLAGKPSLKVFPHLLKNLGCSAALHCLMCGPAIAGVCHPGVGWARWVVRGHGMRWVA